jgi:hypothetical protein
MAKVTDAEHRAVGAEMALARMRVGIAEGLPGELIDRLRGDTEAEMAEDARRLLDAFPKPKSATAVPTGARNGNGETSMNDWIRRKTGH